VAGPVLIECDLCASTSFRFLLSAHYSHYDVTLFTINFVSLVVILIAKLPQLHRVRIFGINKRD
jgi:hypothetical protein